MFEKDMVSVIVKGAKYSDAGYSGFKGDQITVPKDVAQRGCSHGWLEAVDGSIETGERNINPVTINPKKSAQINKSQEVK